MRWCLKALMNNIHDDVEMEKKFVCKPWMTKSVPWLVYADK